MNEIAHLITRPWLMSEGMATLLYSQFTSGRITLERAKESTDQKLQAKAASMSGVKYIGSYASSYMVKHSSGKYVALMPVLGTLTKRGELCSYGMRDYMREIDALNQNEMISAIVLEVEGPGGTVDGTMEFGNSIAQSQKPIVVFGDCTVASADYWIASQAKWIVGNANNPTEFGSIGVLCVHEFWGKYIEENIGSIKIIRAPQSKDKALVNPMEELSADQEKLIVDDLKQLASQFHEAVKTGRGDRLKASETEWGTGKMFKNEEALSMGLIDAIGTIWDAIDKAADLSSARPTQTNANAQKAQQINKPQMNKLVRKASSFFKPRKAAATVAAEPVAAEGDSTPVWTAELTFNTDGSGDGAFCIHPDSGGNDRKFETKIDNNTGNEPPTDPSISEDDNWSAVADAESEKQPEPEPTAQATTVTRMNETVKKKNAEIVKLNARIVQLEAEVAGFKAEKQANENKQAAPATTVVSTGDKDNKRAEKRLSAVEREVDDYARMSQTNIF